MRGKTRSNATIEQTTAPRSFDQLHHQGQTQLCQPLPFLLCRAKLLRRPHLPPTHLATWRLAASERASPPTSCTTGQAASPLLPRRGPFPRKVSQPLVTLQLQATPSPLSKYFLLPRGQIHPTRRSPPSGPRARLAMTACEPGRRRTRRSSSSSKGGRGSCSAPALLSPFMRPTPLVPPLLTLLLLLSPPPHSPHHLASPFSPTLSSSAPQRPLSSFLSIDRPFTTLPLKGSDQRREKSSKEVAPWLRCGW